MIRAQDLDRASQLLRAHEAIFLDDTAAPKPLGHIGLSRREIREYSLLQGALAIARRNEPRVSFAPTIHERLAETYSSGPPRSLEEESSRAVAKALGRELLPGRLLVPFEVLTRDMTAAGVSGSNYLVATSFPSFIAALRAASVTRRLGATVVGPLRDNAVFPKNATGATTTWLSSENTAITENQPTIGQIAATPKIVGALFDLSHQLTKMISPAGEAMLVAELGAAIAAAVDAAALAGSGASGQPTGILSTSGLGAFTGASLDLAALTNAQTDVCTGNAVVTEDALGYCTTPAVAALLKARQRFTGSSTALWEGTVHKGIVEGAPAYSTTAMTTAAMIFGDWSNLLILEWGVLEIMVDPFTQFSTGVTSMRALWQVDTAVRHAGFSIATSIT
jgi:HK97 family phage major capsid protein